jgi:hypothetical protein
MAKIFLLGFVAVALSACIAERARTPDFTASNQICVNSCYGDYCKDLQGNYIGGVQLALHETPP